MLQKKVNFPITERENVQRTMMYSADNEKDADMNTPINLHLQYGDFSNDRGTFVGLCCHSGIVPEDASLGRSESHSCSLSMLRISL